MSKLPKIVGGVATLILLGAGCQQVSTPVGDVQSKPAESTSATEQPKEEIKTDETAQPEEGAFDLNAEALGKGAVKFSWAFDGELPSDARFVIVRDEEPNPEHTGNHFWHRVDGSKREEVWIGVPTGKFHFRACQVDTKDGPCKKYSKDVELDVQ